MLDVFNAWDNADENLLLRSRYLYSYLTASGRKRALAGRLVRYAEAHDSLQYSTQHNSGKSTSMAFVLKSHQRWNTTTNSCANLFPGWAGNPETISSATLQPYEMRDILVVSGRR